MSQTRVEEAQALLQQGLALCERGKFEQAIASFRAALVLAPDCAETHHLGLALAEQGKHSEALVCFDEAIRLRPQHGDAHHHKANLLRRLRRFREAIAAYEQALRLMPESAEVCNHLGLAWLGTGDHHRAIARFREALRHRPGFGEALNNLGLAHAEQGHLTEAIALYEHGLRCQPRSVETHNNLGVALAAQGNHEAAIVAYQQALTLKPDYAEAHNNLGNALRQLGQLDQAALALRQALRLCPRYAEAHNNLGIVLLKQHQHASAIVAYQQAIAIKPEYPEAHLNLALAWLVLGEMEKGWREYEWRLRMKEHAQTTLKQPRWDGSPLEGKTILVRAEQGLGDTLQFVRYAPLLQQRGGRVILEAPPALLPLLSRCAGIDRLVAQGSELPGFDVHVPLLSLPGLLGTTLASVPNAVPYLFADPALRQHWAEQIGSFTGLKIGIAWQGSRTFKEDRHRSIALKHFEPLARLPGVRLFSLQKGYGSEQLRDVTQWGVVDLGSQLDQHGAFTDTAAVMQNLDLVVCSDSSLAHLAGGLGVPVWLVLGHSADWRWLLERADSPWYPSMRLFRQLHAGDWQEVFARIAEEASCLQPRARTPIDATQRSNAEALRQQGTTLCQQGRWSEAIGCFRQALEIAPDSAPLSNNLGVALAQQKQFAEAIAAYRRAVFLRPGYAEARQNLGEALQHQGNFAEAIGCYEEALRLKPTMVQTHNNLGAALLALGRLEQAQQHCERALQLDPGFTQAHRNLGDVLEKRGLLEEATQCHQRALQSRGLSASEVQAIGQERLRQGKLAESITAFRLALEQNPANGEGHFHLGQAHLRQQRWSEAIACFTQAAQLCPTNAEIHDGLGTALRRAGRASEAEACYRRSLELRPASAEVCNHLGIALLEQSRPDEAEDCFRRGLGCNPQHGHLHNNLGVSLEQRGRLEEAIAAYQESLRHQPDAADTHRNLALAWLLTGNFAQGWAEYEWRWQCSSALKRPFTQPRWDGAALAGKTILLHAEQGLGDTLQFVRYAPLVKQRGGTVVVEAPGCLLPLLRSCAGIDRLVAQGSPLPDFDVQVPLLSLPAVLGTTLQTVPNAVPYLSADAALCEKWAQQMRAVSGLKIGIAWQGSAKYQGDRHRSIALKQFAPLARLPGVRLFSLQKGYGSEQLAGVADWGIVDLGSNADAAGAFTDTAAVMQHLDLVVCSDSAVAHLAGALAVPVLLALPVARDWRWLLDRQDSPWYPSMRLFRQQRWGDWHDVFARIAEAVSHGARRSKAG
jgi:tetratricopeptide (TPR) repeat protein